MIAAVEITGSSFNSAFAAPKPAAAAAVSLCFVPIDPVAMLIVFHSVLSLVLMLLLLLLLLLRSRKAVASVSSSSKLNVKLQF